MQQEEELERGGEGERERERERERRLLGTTSIIGIKSCNSLVVERDFALKLGF